MRKCEGRVNGYNTNTIWPGSLITLTFPFCWRREGGRERVEENDECKNSVEEKDDDVVVVDTEVMEKEKHEENIKKTKNSGETRQTNTNRKREE